MKCFRPLVFSRSLTLWVILVALFAMQLHGDQQYSDAPLNSPLINCLYDDGERIWIGTLNGFNVFSKAEKRFLSMKVLPLVSKCITSIEKFRNTIWFGTYGQGLYKILGGEFVHYDVKNSGILSDYINSLQAVRTENGKEMLMIATAQGLSVIDENDDWGGMSVHDGLYTDNIKGLERSDTIGEVLAFGDCGLQRVHYLKGEITDVLKDVQVTSVKKWGDRWWVGTRSEGVIRLGKTFEKTDSLDDKNSGLKSNNIVKIKPFEDELFFLTPDGIFSFNKIYWKTELEGKSFTDANDFSVNSDSIYVSTKGRGFFVCDIKKLNRADILGTLVKKSNEPFYQRWQVLDKVFDGAKINDVVVKKSTHAQQLNIYAATSKGFFEILENGKKVNRIHSDNSILETDNIKGIAFKDFPYSGQFIMYLATYGKGLYRYDGKSWEQMGKNQGLLSNFVAGADYIPSKNEFWFGTDEGINRYNNQDWKGFYNLSINLFQKVKKTCYFNGKYYFATDFGIGVYDGRKWEKIGLKEGLNDMVVSDLVPDAENKILYIGTQHGGLFRWNGKNVLSIPIENESKSLLGFKEIKSICLHDDKLYVTLKNDLIQIESRRQKSLKKLWELPDGVLNKVMFYDQYIFVIYDSKVLYTKYNKWEKF